MNSTLILKTSYDTGIAFHGKAAAKLLDLLTDATPVEVGSYEGGYGWHLPDPDKVTDAVQITYLCEPLPEHERKKSLAKRLTDAEAVIAKHTDLISAAEQLNDESV